MRVKRKSLIIVTVIAVIALLGVVGLGLVVNDQISTLELKSWNYIVADLDSEGELDSSDENIVTKDYIKVDGLEITVNEEAEITYRVVFYDEDKEYISETDELTTDFQDSEIPEGAEYCKIVITPVDDNEISIFEKGDFVEMLNVKYAR
ncbi:MAG: hypothetical protein IJF72_01120 [Clostridia bacterium]|nr:hypothetical protein [Clostridia bacterium]